MYTEKIVKKYGRKHINLWALERTLLLAAAKWA